MKASTPGVLSSQWSASGLLDWENLSAQPPQRAFRKTLAELVLRPGDFFEKMSLTGGLREPLTFWWLLLTAFILLSFPLALAYFGLTAPDPLEVSTEVYNRHLLAPRAAGFAVLLLPIVLALGGMGNVIGGTFFHLGARAFGARNWEGSVSIWCYARSAGLAALTFAEALACVIAIACSLVTLAWPTGRTAMASVARTSLLAFGGLAALLSILLFLWGIFSGCRRSFRLPATQGAAAALAGLLIVGIVAAGIGFGFKTWGLKGGLIAGGAAGALLIILWILHRLTAGLSDAVPEPS